MLSILQSLLIAVLTPISKVSSKMNDRFRNICIQITCLLFPLYFIYIYIGLAHSSIFVWALDRHNGRHLLGCLMLMLLIFFSLDRKPEKVKWNPWIMYPMIICGVWMIVISCIHHVGGGYRAFAMMLIVAYPCLYLVWNNRGDYDKLFDPLARAICLIGILFFIFSFYQATKGDLLIVEGRCNGLVHNANLFSMIGMSTACSSMYLLVKDRMMGFRFLFYAIALGTGIAVVLMGQSRISLAVCLVNTVVALFFYLRYSPKSKGLAIAVKSFCMIGFIITMILLSNACLVVEQNMEAKEATVAETVIESTEAAKEGAPEVPAPVTSETGTSSVFERLQYDENSTLDTFTAGRYHIWQGYMKYMNLLGNDFYKSDWAVMTQSSVRHAHNNFIEMAYRFGVPLGILFILLELVVCLKALQFLFVNRQKRIVLLWPVIIVVVFLFESMFDIATLPFEREAPFYFYLALIPMVDINYRFKDK